MPQVCSFPEVVCLSSSHRVTLPIPLMRFSSLSKGSTLTILFGLAGRCRVSGVRDSGHFRLRECSETVRHRGNVILRGNAVRILPKPEGYLIIGNVIDLFWCLLSYSSTVLMVQVYRNHGRYRTGFFPS